MRERLKEIESSAIKEIEADSGNKEALEVIRIRYLGRKGALTELFKKMDELPQGARPEMGWLINEAKNNIIAALEGSLKGVSASGEKGEHVDVTLPGIATRHGKIHPIMKTIYEVCDIFASLGFRVIEGPEIETEFYNFEALNIPLEHPSRDAFDTFYLKAAKGQKFLLRSHTSPVQARFMKKNKPPFSIVVPGKVFRPDATDASHSFMFHQVEGLAVGDIKFSDLKGALALFAGRMFGDDIKTRFRPSFFPFTEPSAELDISCAICKGHGTCSVCGGKGWLEILGAGMVNPKVFEAVGYDPERWTGFAFGMGVERIAMLKYGINDIRLFFENDVRFLRQF